MRYFSTFISGTEQVIKKWLAENIGYSYIVKLWDGLVIYETSEGIDKVAKIPIFNNTFILTDTYDATTDMSIHQIVREIITGNTLNNNPNWVKKYRTFRVIYSIENEISKVDKDLLGKLEGYVSDKTNLKLNRGGADTELWILKRSEGVILTGFRITKNPIAEKTFQKGQLRPQLAYILNYISEPNKQDIFLDPFAGFGAIPLARKKYFPAKEITASDKSRAQLKNLSKTGGVVIKDWDALNLTKLIDNTVNRIVTDPPWGIYKQMNIQVFYQKMLNEFTRVVKHGGIIVVLTAQKDILEKLIYASKDLNLMKKLDVLVSGKKSAIYKLKRK